MEAFAALADPVRRRILELLRDGEQPAGAVVERIGVEFGIGQPAVSMQLKVLREAGLARVRADGSRRLYSLDGGPLAAVDAWLTGFAAYWDQRLDALDTELARGRRRTRDRESG